MVSEALLLDPSIGFEASTPAEHRVGQDVVVDLVAGGRRPVLGARADDALRREAPEDRGGLALVNRRVAREIVDSVRDLRPRGGDEEVVHRRSSRFFAR